MKRQSVSTVELKAKKNEMSYKQLVKYPLEAMKAKVEKAKNGVINPESSFKNPFSLVNRLEMQPSSSKIELLSTEKKQPFKLFPQKQHMLSTHEFQKPKSTKPRDDESSSEQLNQFPSHWNPSTRPKSEYQLAFKNLPPANYFQTESQRRVICSVFEELDDILDNQRFSMKLKRILQQRENDIESQKRFKRFKRRKQNEALQKNKVPFSTPGDSEIRLNRQYNLTEIWYILKPHWLKHKKITQQQFETEEFPCTEFVTFLTEVGFQNQNMVRQFFDEMASFRLQAVQIPSESANNINMKSGGVASLLKVHLFLANFQKYVNNNAKILYLNSKSAAFTRNLTLKNYIAQWHASYPQIKLKLRQKKQKELMSIQFVQEIQANEEDEIIFELEEHLQSRQALLEKPNNTYKETEVQSAAVNYIEAELQRAREETALVQDEICDRVKGQMKKRRELVIQKRQFCSLLSGVEVFNSVGDFLEFLDTEIVQAEYKRDSLTEFCESFVDDKEKFIEPLVTLLEIADFMFRENYNETQTPIISRFVDLLKANYRKERNLPENEVIKSAQRIPMKIFREAHAEAIGKKELKVDLLHTFKQKISEHFQKNLAIKVSHGNSMKNNNAEMNFVYEYLLKHLHGIDNRLEKCDVYLTQIVEYLDMMEEREQSDHLGVGEDDIEDKYHNLLEKILFDLYQIISEDVPENLTFLISTRTFKHRKFIESLSQIGTKISNYISVSQSPSSVKDAKSPQNSSYFKTGKTESVKDIVKEAEENDEQEFLLNVLNKPKVESTAKKTDFTQQENEFSQGGLSQGTFFSPSTSLPYASKHLRNSAISEAKSSQKNTAFKSTGVKDNIPSSKTKGECEAKVYEVFDILEGENEAQQIIKNIKNNSSMISRQNASSNNLKTMKHSYSTRFDDFKLEFPPEYYNLHPMKAQSEEYKIYMDKKSTKFPADIDKKVQKFQMEIQFDEAKRKLKLGK